MTPTDAMSILESALHEIAPEVDLTAVDQDAPMQEELDIDSMDFLNLVTAIHQLTGIEIPERDYPQLSTVRAFVSYLAAAPVTS